MIMKLLILCFATFTIFGCIHKPSGDKNLYASESNSNTTMKQDTVKVIAKIKTSMPIGWGTMYTLEMQKIEKETLLQIDNTFRVSVSVSAQSRYKNIDSLEKDQLVEITFIASEKTTKKSYIPAGVTGVVDKNGVIWDMVAIKKVN